MTMNSKQGMGSAVQLDGRDVTILGMIEPDLATVSFLNGRNVYLGIFF